MEQFFLWLNVIAFAILASSLSSSFQILLKSKCVWIKYYLLTKLGFILWLIFYTYDYFCYIYISPENLVPGNKILAFIVLLFSSYTIYFFARYLLAITGKQPGLTIHIFSITIPAAFFCTGAVFIILGKPVVENYLHISFYLILFIYSWYGVMYWKTITHEPSRSWGFPFIILTIVFTPLIFFEYYLFHFSLANIHYFPDHGFSLPAYCIIWGLWMIISNSFLSQTAGIEKIESIPEDFINKHNITSREKEIISYLIAGYNNVDIASRLFISLRTVDTHVYNIYKKCSVKNRIALLKEIDSHRTFK